MSARTWDIGDPEPDGVGDVWAEFGEDEDGGRLVFGRTFSGDWKWYVFGGKCYLKWPELVRRFGPLQEKQ